MHENKEGTKTISMSDFLASLQHQLLASEIKILVLEEILMANNIVTKETLNIKYNQKAIFIQQSLEKHMAAQQNKKLITPLSPL